VTVRSDPQWRGKGQIAILATLACDYSNDHPLAIHVAHLEMSQFGASHAGAIERHQQRSAKQCSGCVDQTGHFLPAQHCWRSTLVLPVR
jgi:hypothetical protein